MASSTRGPTRIPLKVGNFKVHVVGYWTSTLYYCFYNDNNSFAIMGHGEYYLVSLFFTVLAGIKSPFKNDNDLGLGTALSHL